jgi:spore coat polysaccharide biosynthesis predicted glycosyltransferase SpsG
MKKSILFLLPFGRQMGVGHLVRQAVWAQELSARGYRTLLWGDGAFEEISPTFRQRAQAAFSAIIPLTHQLPTRFPAPEAVEVLSTISDLAAVIVDDYRSLADPLRRQTMQALHEQLRTRGVPLILIDGMPELEFDLADHIVNLELAQNESSYRPDWLAKMHRGLHFALSHEVGIPAEEIPGQLPSRPFMLMIGGTDPKHCALGLLQGLLSSGFSPVLVSPRSPRPEDAAAMAELSSALAAYPQHLWLENLSPGQMATVRRAVHFSVIGPGTSPIWSHFADRTPFIGVFSNPSLAANSGALPALGIPVIRAQNHEELMASWGSNTPCRAQFAPADISAALSQLRSSGFLDHRLPERPPFTLVGSGGAARLSAALGL